MRVFVAILVGVALAGLGIFLSVDTLLVGGIVQSIHAFSAHPVQVSNGVWGIVRALIFEAPLLLVYGGIALGFLIMDMDKPKKFSLHRRSSSVHKGR